MAGSSTSPPAAADRIAPARPVPAAFLSTNPATPALRKRRTYSRSSYCVSTSTRARGWSLRSCRVASSPPSPGMAMSIRTTSGSSLRHSSTAAWPSAASPTTSTSGTLASNALMPSRRMPWSSAIRTRMRSIAPPSRERYAEREVGALSPRGLDPQRPAQHLDALAHAEQSPAAAGGVGLRDLALETLAVVFDVDAQRPVLHRGLDQDALRVRVLVDVGDRLLHHAEDGGLVLGREPLVETVPLAPDRDSLGAQVAIGVPVDRRAQAEIVEHRGAQVHDQAVDCVERRDRQLGLVLEARLGAQLHHQRGQALAGVVVQLARDAAALVLLRGDQFAEELAHLRGAGGHARLQLVARLLQRRAHALE